MRGSRRKTSGEMTRTATSLTLVLAPEPPSSNTSSTSLSSRLTEHQNFLMVAAVLDFISQGLRLRQNLVLHCLSRFPIRLESRWQNNKARVRHSRSFCLVTGKWERYDLPCFASIGACSLLTVYETSLAERCQSGGYTGEYCRSQETSVYRLLMNTVIHQVDLVACRSLIQISP